MVTADEKTRDAALFVNSNLVGKVIKTACVFDNGTPVQEIRIAFTDGTAISIGSEYDESFIFRECDPLGGGT